MTTEPTCPVCGKQFVLTGNSTAIPPHRLTINANAGKGQAQPRYAGPWCDGAPEGTTPPVASERTV